MMKKSKETIEELDLFRQVNSYYKCHGCGAIEEYKGPSTYYNNFELLSGTPAICRRCRGTYIVLEQPERIDNYTIASKLNEVIRLLNEKLPTNNITEE